MGEGVLSGAVGGLVPGGNVGGFVGDFVVGGFVGGFVVGRFVGDGVAPCGVGLDVGDAVAGVVVGAFVLPRCNLMTAFGEYTASPVLIHSSNRPLYVASKASTTTVPMSHPSLVGFSIRYVERVLFTNNITHTIVLLGSGPFLWLKSANTIKMILDFCVAKNPSRAIISRIRQSALLTVPRP